MIAYLKNPQEIYDLSFATIQQEADFARIPANAKTIAERIVHTCGMTEIARDLVISDDFFEAGVDAIKKGKPILVDAQMVRSGITAHKKYNNDVLCTLNDPSTDQLANQLQTTRSAAAIRLWLPHLEGAIAVIGNAPTALFALLELVDSGAPKPAAIIAFPVGFVGATESKAELVGNSRNLPFATLPGRRGGSAMAAAATNALLKAL